MNITIVCTLAGGGLLSLLLTGKERLASWIGAISCIIALAGELFTRSSEGNPRETLYLLPIVFVGIAAALHAPGYLKGHAGKKTGVFWFFFHLTVLAMLEVFHETAFLRFILFWELMGLMSFFLVMFDAESRDAVRASWIYLGACELGGLLLLFVFASDLTTLLPANLRFLLLAAAFGLKAGFPFLHVWLPEAHPAAPAPVSALMSGAMIPLGFLGLFRFSVIPDWGGWFFLVLGLAGAFGGILTGMVQTNIKRLLAYSSFENIGIITIGFGLGILGKHYRIPLMEEAGFAGAFLHTLTHGLLKGSLFLGAGSIFHSAGTLNMDRLGGLMKKLPVTGGAFAAASAGISGLPPFAGFTSELLIYIGAFAGIACGTGPVFFAAFLTAIVLALTGACACSAFCKTVGAVFQGLPRTEIASDAKPEEKQMTAAVLLPLLLSFAVPFTAWLLPSLIKSAELVSILQKNAWLTGILLVLAALLMLWKRTRKKDLRSPGTWDCGYSRPTARMEYTGTAFVQPSADFFDGFLKQKKSLRKPEGITPDKASLETEWKDPGIRLFWGKLYAGFSALAEKIHNFQSGYLHLYVFIMVLALALMLVWGTVFQGGK